MCLAMCRRRSAVKPRSPRGVRESPRKRGVETVGGGLVETLEQVPVVVVGGLDRRMAETLGHHVGVFPLGDEQRRVGVAKSTAHRTCSVLTDTGMLTRTDAGTLLVSSHQSASSADGMKLSSACARCSPTWSRTR